MHLTIRAFGAALLTAALLQLMPSAALATPVAANGYHSLWIGQDGLMWSMGYNSSGRLGDGTTTNRSTPVAVGYFDDWVAVAAGYDSSYGLRADGSLWSWGDNAYGQLGIGSTTDKYLPVRVSSPSTFTAVAAGAYHVLALKADGTLWAWGRNNHGQLGIGTRTTALSPRKVGSDYDWKSVSAGAYHSGAVKTNDSAYIWGNNYDGQLGDGSAIEWYEYSDALHDKIQPWQMAGPGVADALFLAGYQGFGRYAPGYPGVAGRVTSWGSNRHGQLGNGEWGVIRDSSPGAILSTSQFSKIASVFHTVGLKPDGSLEAWGRNSRGQVGLNSTATVVPTPQPITTLTGVSDIACGEEHTLATRDSDASLWGWGYDNLGQLGLAGTSGSRYPRRITGLRQAYLSTPSSPSSIYYGRYITVTGKMLPRHSGPVTASFYRWNGKSWVFIKTVTAKTAVWSTYTRWSVAYKPHAKGKWYVKATHADAEHLTSRSPTRTFYVK